MRWNRRAFLCGRDPVNGYDFEHRRQWIVDRIQLLCSVIAIGLGVYAVMSNLIVVRISDREAESWSDEEVAQRWTELFSRHALIHRFLG